MTTNPTSDHVDIFKVQRQLTDVFPPETAASLESRLLRGFDDMQGLGPDPHAHPVTPRYRTAFTIPLLNEYLAENDTATDPLMQADRELVAALPHEAAWATLDIGGWLPGQSVLSKSAPGPSGIVLLVSTEPGWAEARCLYVRPEHRGTGLASALVAGCSEWAKARRRRLRAVAHPENAKAIHLFTKHGAEIITPRTHPGQTDIEPISTPEIPPNALTSREKRSYSRLFTSNNTDSGGSR